MNHRIRQGALVLAAAALFTSIASASTMEARVPFAFDFAGKQLPAGSYRMSVAPVNGLIRVQNANTGETHFAGSALSGNYRGQGQSRLHFVRRADGSMALRTIEPSASPAHSVRPSAQ